MRGFNTYFVLLFSLLFGGLVAVSMGKELGWDLAAYHYYNAYAFFHDRSNNDVWSAFFVQRYHNPLINFLLYFFVQYFSPRMTVFFLGAIHGVNLWLLYLIAREYIVSYYKPILAIALGLLGLYGPVVWSGMGASQQDNLIASFVLGSVLLQIKFFRHYIDERVLARTILFCSGVVLGFGVGLKLTAAPFFVGVVAAFFFVPMTRQDRLFCIFVWGGAYLLGVCVSSGFWMWRMWQEHHNPFFPYLNQIFHSPDIPELSWQDKRFMPTNLIQAVFYPFYFVKGCISDVGFFDLRFAAVYLLFIIVAVKKIIFPSHIVFNGLIIWFFAFFISSYVIWQLYFSIARYLAPLEMLVPLVIYLLITAIFRNEHVRGMVFGLVFYTLIYTVFFSPSPRCKNYSGDFFNVVLPSVVERTPQAMVLMPFENYAFYPATRVAPYMFFVPFFPEKWKFIGMPMIDPKTKIPYEKKNLDFLAKEFNENKKRVANYQQPIFMLMDRKNKSEFSLLVRQFELVEHGECEEVTSDRQKLTQKHVLLCPLKKLG